jgi:hypothetical protein
MLRWKVEVHMIKLTRGMFGMGDDGVDPRPARALFGFSSGNCVRIDFVHNGGWYNKAGEWLGWGDLCPSDLERIAAVLDEGEMFVILRESDRPRTKGQPDMTPADLAKKAAYVVTNGRFHVVDHRGYYTRQEDVNFHHLGAKVLTPEVFARMLGVEVPLAT